MLSEMTTPELERRPFLYMDDDALFLVMPSVDHEDRWNTYQIPSDQIAQLINAVIKLAGSFSLGLLMITALTTLFESQVEGREISRERALSAATRLLGELNTSSIKRALDDVRESAQGVSCIETVICHDEARAVRYSGFDVTVL